MNKIAWTSAIVVGSALVGWLCLRPTHKVYYDVPVSLYVEYLQTNQISEEERDSDIARNHVCIEGVRVYCANEIQARWEGASDLLLASCTHLPAVLLYHLADRFRRKHAYIVHSSHQSDATRVSLSRQNQTLTYVVLFAEVDRSTMEELGRCRATLRVKWANHIQAIQMSVEPIV